MQKHNPPRRVSGCKLSGYPTLVQSQCPCALLTRWVAAAIRTSKAAGGTRTRVATCSFRTCVAGQGVYCSGQCPPPLPVQGTGGRIVLVSSIMGQSVVGTGVSLPVPLARAPLHLGHTSGPRPFLPSPPSTRSTRPCSHTPALISDPRHVRTPVLRRPSIILA